MIHTGIREDIIIKKTTQQQPAVGAPVFTIGRGHGWPVVDRSKPHALGREIPLVVKFQLDYSKKGERKMDREEFQKAYGKVVAKAWADPDFKIPDDVEFRIVENTDKIVHLILPPEPAGQLSEEELVNVAGGGVSWFHASSDGQVDTEI